jgi:hypothetical protein
MNEIICFFKGHKIKIISRKEERLIFWGEKSPQYRIVNDIFCERCGKMKSPLSGSFISY